MPVTSPTNVKCVRNNSTTKLTSDAICVFTRERSPSHATSAARGSSARTEWSSIQTLTRRSNPSSSTEKCLSPASPANSCKTGPNCNSNKWQDCQAIPPQWLSLKRRVLRRWLLFVVWIVEKRRKRFIHYYDYSNYIIVLLNFNPLSKFIRERKKISKKFAIVTFGSKLNLQ